MTNTTTPDYKAMAQERAEKMARYQADFPYRIWLTNFGYYSQGQFSNRYAALAHGKKNGFEFCVDAE